MMSKKIEPSVPMEQTQPTPELPERQVGEVSSIQYTLSAFIILNAQFNIRYRQ